MDKPVTQEEIIKFLTRGVRSRIEGDLRFALADRIKAHGIAPQAQAQEAVGYTGQSSLDELASGKCSAIQFGTYSERYCRTIPLYTAAPPPSQVQALIGEIDKLRHYVMGNEKVGSIKMVRVDQLNNILNQYRG